MTFTFDLEIWVKITSHPLSKSSVMTFTFDIEFWVKFTSHPLSKSSVIVKYEPDMAKGRVYKLRTCVFQNCSKKDKLVFRYTLFIVITESVTHNSQSCTLLLVKQKNPTNKHLYMNGVT